MGRASAPRIVLGPLLLCMACGPGEMTEGTGGTTGTGGTSTGSGGASTGSGGAAPGTGGAAAGSGGATGSGGRVSATGGSSGTGGRAPGSGGAAGAGKGGATGTGGSATGSGGATGTGGSTMGGGGAGGCVPNIACKLTAPASSGDIYQDCVDRINSFLTKCACLPALARATEGEACADQMAEYDAGMNAAHAGFEANICKPRGSQNECPGYSSNSQVIGLCMQQMWDEGPPPAGSCTGTCYEQHGHYINMTDKTVHKVACGFFTTSAGKVWAVQNFF